MFKQASIPLLTKNIAGNYFTEVFKNALLFVRTNIPHSMVLSCLKKNEINRSMKEMENAGNLARNDYISDM